ncbi:hypothetical protein EYF80_046633 [Liparis tanakae]|uniref:Uncharacterized protein n=1 Tax=Liparis tanakae TaxID=230148 RepID=A0A4Z2FPN2_9TELE|nr:hypothetical protein EYF80_046633 [Liparis tanakae]
MRLNKPHMGARRGVDGGAGARRSGGGWGCRHSEARYTGMASVGWRGLCAHSPGSSSHLLCKRIDLPGAP